MSHEDLVERSCSDAATAELKLFSHSLSEIDKEESPEKLIPNDDVIRSNGKIENDESSDVIATTLPDDVIDGRDEMKEEGKEDRYARLLEQLRRFDEHVPLHKAVCCSLCRRKEKWLKKKTMQDRRCLSCPSPADDSDETRLFFAGHETDFGRLMLGSGGLRSPPSSSPSSSGLVSLADLEETDNATSSSSNSSSAPPCGASASASANSDDHLAEKPNGAAGHAESNRLSSEENPDGTSSSSSSHSNAKSKRRTWADQEEEEEGGAGDFRDGFLKSSAFRRSVSAKSASRDGRGGGRGRGRGGGGDGAARGSFPSRRYESFRAPKDPTADLQPITDPALLLKLQQSVTAVQLSQLHLSPKDQKMLAVLLAKKEQELATKHRRESSYLFHEGTNSKTSSSAALRRQLSLNESRLKYQKQKHSDWQTSAVNDRRQRQGLRGDIRNSEHTAANDNNHCCCRCSTHSDKDAGECQQGNRNGHSSHEGHSDHVCCSRYAASLAPSAYKNQHSEKQLQQAMERKKQVEQHLKEQRKKTDKYLTQLREKNEQEQQKATLTRQQRTNQLAEKSRLHNLHAHQKLLEAKETKNAEFKELLASHEEKKAHLTAAELKVKQLRENEKSKKESEIRRKLEKSQNRQRELEDELTRWQTELTEYRQMQESNAQTIAMATIAKKKESVAREREAKERQQKENLTRMLAKESEWRAELEAAIQSKDERSRLIQEEKTRMIQKSRDAALISRRIRDELGLNQSVTDLDLLGRID